MCKSRYGSWNLPDQAAIAFADLGFEYEGVRATAGSEEIRLRRDGELVILKRNHLAESHARDALKDCGWRETLYCGYEVPTGRDRFLCIIPSDAKHLTEPMERVGVFNKKFVPQLLDAGWNVEIEENVRYVPASEIKWDVALDSESGNNWFEIQLGIKVEDKRVDLRPILAQVFKEHASKGILSLPPHKIAGDHVVFGLDGRVINLPLSRIAAILQPLVELFGGVHEWPSDLRLPKARLPETAKFEKGMSAAKVLWKTSDELRQLGRQFATFDRLEPQPEPKGFDGKLREYQREGVAWLQFLREFGFGGVLADDMGLGKTVQLLAHIQTEKAAGRMDRPCLIVAPTSTMPNWRRESERFTPGLKLITLQGTGRSERFASLKDVDIALTTYPLLARDKGLVEQIQIPSSGP